MSSLCRTFEAVAATTALLLVEGSCANQATVDRPPLDNAVEVVQETDIFAYPGDIESYMATIAVGAEVEVLCYATSAAINLDSVKVSVAGIEGFAFVGNPGDKVGKEPSDPIFVNTVKPSGGLGSPNFSPDVSKNKNLDECGAADLPLQELIEGTLTTVVA